MRTVQAANASSGQATRHVQLALSLSFREAGRLSVQYTAWQLNLNLSDSNEPLKGSTHP